MSVIAESAPRPLPLWVRPVLAYGIAGVLLVVYPLVVPDFWAFTTGFFVAASFPDFALRGRLEMSQRPPSRATRSRMPAKPKDPVLRNASSTLNPTPRTVPEGVAAEPRFSTVALNTMFVPAPRVDGLHETLVTMTSGKPVVGMAVTRGEDIPSP